MPIKTPPRRAAFHLTLVAAYLEAASAAAEAAAPTAAAASDAAEPTAAAASEAASAAAAGAGAGAGAGASTAGAGAGATASSFLPQAARATAAITEANRSDLFIPYSSRSFDQKIFDQRGRYASRNPSWIVELQPPDSESTF